MGGIGLRRRVARTPSTPRSRRCATSTSSTPLVRLPLSLGVGAFVTSALPRIWRSDVASPSVPARARRGGRGRRAGARRPRPGGRGLAAHRGRFRGRPDELARRGRLPRRPARTDPHDRAARGRLRRADLGPHHRRADPGPGPVAVDGARAGHRRARRDPAAARLASSRQSRTRGRSGDLPAALDALGATHVVVRNDLDPDEVDAPDPRLVRTAVANVPGARLVASFGTTSDGDAAIEVYELRPRRRAPRRGAGLGGPHGRRRRSRGRPGRACRGPART